MKIILLTALCALTFQANAQTFGVGAGYEYDSATKNSGGLKSIEKSSVLAGVRTDYGQFDAGLYEVKIRGERFYDSQPGAEVGYGNGFQAGPVNINGRIGLGKVWNRGLGSTSDTGTYSTYTIGAGIPITPQLGGSVSFRYRPEHDFSRQQQYSVGLTYSVSKSLQLLGSVRQTRSPNMAIMNGVSLQARYYFLP